MMQHEFLQSTTFPPYQVERRVVSQLALAHERQLIQPGCALRLSVSHPKDNTSLTKDAQQTDNHSTSSPPMIKLQMVKKGKLKKEEYVDIDLEKVTSTFTG